ncbi:MAG TPA: carboxypeptidase regulatory-like domain-containing protein [bacterium]|nr:carboxypeptidase regulatory-like domain-containing protein [bacterium]
MDLRKYLAFLAATAFIATAGCGSKDEDDLAMGGGSGGGSTSSAAPAPAGTASIAGKVTLSGKAPIPAKITFDADPVCKSQHASAANDELVTVDAKGDLANVFVYVKEGAPSTAAPTTPVVLTQHGCMYTPHVFGIQVNQPLQIVNEDATLHNVHCMATINDSFNVGQPSQGMKTEKKFSKPEVLVHFKCDVHSWMHCVAGVVTNPYFSVSGADGSFKIASLPAGHYTVVAVHEKYGESQPQQVDVKDGEAKSLNFSFTAQ